MIRACLSSRLLALSVVALVTSTGMVACSGESGGDADPVGGAAGEGSDADGATDSGGNGDEAGTGGAAHDATESAGCGETTAIAEGTWTPQTLMVDTAERAYQVYLPNGYDPATAYPIVYQFHGCNSNPVHEDNNVPVHASSGDQAIFVRGRASGDCWDNNADDAFTAALFAHIEGTLCVDTSRRFASGYSSGSYYTNHLACVDATRFAGVATIAGGPGGGDCMGSVPALLIHDTNDNTVKLPQGEAARAIYLTQNGCDAQAATTSVEPEPCVSYAGCDEGMPVVWCQTAGQDHSRQDALAGPAFWGFFQSLL